MGVVSMAKDIKRVYVNALVMYKVGAFMQVIGKDSYIVSYLLGYAVKNTNDNIPTCGFPKNAINKVLQVDSFKKSLKFKQKIRANFRPVIYYCPYFLIFSQKMVQKADFNNTFHENLYEY